MTITITPEYVMRLGEDMKRIVLETSTPEELTARLTPEELTARLTPEQLTARLTPEQRLAGLAADDLLSHLSFEEIEAYLEEHRPKSDEANGKPA